MYLIKKLEKEEVIKVLPALEKIANSSKYTAGFKVKDLHKIFAAYFNDKIVAYGGITCYHGFWGLRACAVSPEHRGNGLQRLLIQERVKFLKKTYEGIKHVNVWVGLKNIYSMNNLLGEGFKPVKTKTKIYHGIECMKLRKVL